jgi:hypothetical protein
LVTQIQKNIFCQLLFLSKKIYFWICVPKKWLNCAVKKQIWKKKQKKLFQEKVWKKKYIGIFVPKKYFWPCENKEFFVQGGKDQLSSKFGYQKLKTLFTFVRLKTFYVVVFTNVLAEAHVSVFCLWASIDVTRVEYVIDFLINEDKNKIDGMGFGTKLVKSSSGYRELAVRRRFLNRNLLYKNYLGYCTINKQKPVRFSFGLHLH